MKHILLLFAYFCLLTCHAQYLKVGINGSRVVFDDNSSGHIVGPCFGAGIKKDRVLFELDYSREGGKFHDYKILQYKINVSTLYEFGNDFKVFLGGRVSYLLGQKTSKEYDWMQGEWGREFLKYPKLNFGPQVSVGYGKRHQVRLTQYIDVFKGGMVTSVNIVYNFKDS